MVLGQLDIHIQKLTITTADKMWRSQTPATGGNVNGADTLGNSPAIPQKVKHSYHLTLPFHF